jgi:hypothetical protein
MLNNKIYNISKNIVITNEVLSSYITRFWDEAFTPLINKGETYHLMILCKIAYSESIDSFTYKTIAPLRRVEYTDKDLFVDYLSERLSILIESYNPQSVNKIIFTYIIKKGKITKVDRLLLKDLSDKSLPFHEFNKIKLPVSMNPSDYGKILVTNIVDNFTRYIATSNKRVFQIDVSQDKMINKVTILGSSDVKWTDTMNTDGSLVREIGKSTIYFLDGVIFLQKQNLNAKAFRKLRSRL